MNEIRNFSINYSTYYDLLYNDKNYESEVDYIITLIDKFGNKGKRILELGCGTGNHAYHFCKKGFMVTGIDRSLEMIELAKKKNIINFNPLQQDIIKFSFKEEYDTVISLFHVVSYLNSNNELLSCFECANKSLNSDGIFIFDVWYTPAVYHQMPQLRIKRYKNDLIEVTRISEPIIHINSSIVDVNFEIIIEKKDELIEKIYEVHKMRHFTYNEIELLAAQSGFIIREYHEYFSSNIPSMESWNVCFILQKI